MFRPRPSPQQKGSKARALCFLPFLPPFPPFSTFDFRGMEIGAGNRSPRTGLRRLRDPTRNSIASLSPFPLFFPLFPREACGTCHPGLPYLRQHHFSPPPSPSRWTFEDVNNRRKSFTHGELNRRGVFLFFFPLPPSKSTGTINRPKGGRQRDLVQGRGEPAASSPPSFPFFPRSWPTVA